MPTLKSSGTLTTTVGTSRETLGTTITDNGTFILELDLVNLAAGDILEASVDKKLLSGGTLRTMFVYRFDNAQVNPIKQSIPFTSDIEITFYLRQTFGTSRSIPWKVLQL